LVLFVNKNRLPNNVNTTMLCSEWTRDAFLRTSAERASAERRHLRRIEHVNYELQCC